MRTRLFITAGALIVATVVGTAPPAIAASPTAATYDIRISGSSSNNRFTIAGTLSTRATITRTTTNGVNPIEVCLRAGSPAAAPSTGAIQYGTNSACFRSAGANVDTSQVRSTAKAISIVPDGRLQATFLNQWNARGGVTACVYAPVSGSITLKFSGSKLTGSIDLAGFGSGVCGRSTYKASITGTRK